MSPSLAHLSALKEAKTLASTSATNMSRSSRRMWKNAPQGPVRKNDVTIAKNYLTEQEIRELNRIVTMYLDYAEDQARRRRPMHMADWVEKLDAFLAFNERDILTHAGKISQALAEERAHAEFETYEAERRKIEAATPTSDFDRFVEKTRQLTGEKKKPLPKPRNRKRRSKQ